MESAVIGAILHPAAYRTEDSNITAEGLLVP